MQIDAYWYRRTDTRPWLRLQGADRGKNFGDEYCSDFVAWWTSTRPRRTRLRRGRLITGGSILHHLQCGDTVLSVGARSAGSRVPQNVQYFGARGPLTAGMIRNHVGFATAEPFIGDIGFFVNDVYQVAEVRPVRHSLLLLPHYRHARHWKSEASRNRLFRNATFLQPSVSPMAAARAINLHESVITSSLHGLIFGLSLHRTVYWIAPPTNEPTFKYCDLLSLIGCSQLTPIPDIMGFALGQHQDFGSLEAVNQVRASLPAWEAFSDHLA